MSGIINPYASESSDRTSGGERVRLLACGKCKTIEVLDPYNGPRELASEYDVVLNIAVEKHRDGVEQIPHAPAALMDVPKADWDNPEVQGQIRTQVQASFDPNAETGLGAEAYAVMDTFKSDAMDCWARHNRNPQCGDYKSDSKQLVPNTSKERAEAGLAKFDVHNPSTKRYLCEYCPVHTLVTDQAKRKAGMYD